MSDSPAAKQNPTSSGGGNRAVLPAMAPPPFPEPQICPARRVPGAVLSPPPSIEALDESEEGASAATPTTTLERRASVAGNILLIEDPEDNSNFGGSGTSKRKRSRKAYLLQRKIKNKVFGTVRVGYLLMDSPGDDGVGLCDGGKDDVDGSTGTDDSAMWEVAPSTTGIYPHEMVAVSVEEKSEVLSSEGEGGLTTLRRQHSNTVQDPKTELSALQIVASNDPEGSGHVIGTSIVAADQRYVYTITPYHKEGSLHEYCCSFSSSAAAEASAGKGTQLAEGDARYFFRQILKVSCSMLLEI